jgi:hemolysin activation/secretion protein
MILSLLFNISLYAVSDSADALRQTQENIPKTSKKQAPSIEYRSIEPHQLVKSDKTIFIKQFKFVGNTSIDDAKLNKLVTSYKNKELTLEDINTIISIITDAYRKEGYFVARAYLPQQTISNNILQIGILEGNYGKIKLLNDSSTSSSILEQYIQNIDKNKSINIQEVERAVLLLNDMSGVEVKSARLSAGSKVGTSDFTIKTQNTSLVDGYIFADNYGSRYTGYNRVGLGINTNSLLGIGDTISFNGLLTHKQGLESGALKYSMPLGESGLSGNFSVFKTNYSLGNEYKSLEAFGDAKGGNIGLSYPIKRTKIESLNLDFNINRKILTDTIGAIDERTNKTINSMDIGLNWDNEHELFLIDGKTNFNIAYTKGNLSDNSGSQTAGEYDKLNLDFSHIFYLSNGFNLNTYLNTQHVLGHKNLDGSEEFTVGGANGVRFFPISEQTGDNGYVLGAELFYTLKSFNGFNSMISTFINSGKAWEEVPEDEQSSSKLSDIGLGYYFDYESIFGKLIVAKQLGNQTISADKYYSTKFLFQIGMTF